MTLKQTDVRNATHVKLTDGSVEKIALRWGIGADGSLAKLSQGGFGVVTESGRRIGLFEGPRL